MWSPLIRCLRSSYYYYYYYRRPCVVRQLRYCEEFEMVCGRFNDHRMAYDSFPFSAKFSSVSLRAGRSVCVVELLDVGSWIETARLSVASDVDRRPCSDSRHVTAPYKLVLYYYYYYYLPGPMPGPSSRQFPRIPLSRFWVPLLSRPSTRVTEMDFWFYDSIA